MAAFPPIAVSIKMELEFDKEIDALLKRHAPTAITAGSLTSAHLDADEIAAFAENALPANTRNVYIKHLADCDRCRTALAQTISFLPEAETQAASSAVSKEIPLVTPELPWWRKIFATPGLAISMGALVVVFAGLLAYTFYKGGQGGQLAKLDTAAEKPTANIAAAQPTSSPGAANAIGGLAPPSSPAVSTSSSANTSVTNEPVGANGSGSAKTATDEDQISSGQKELEEAPSAEKKPATAAAPAPPPPVTDQPKDVTIDGVDQARREDDAKKAAQRAETADKTELAKRDAELNNKQIYDGNMSPKMKSGPSRNSQQQNTISASGATGRGMQEPNRAVSGKAFEKKDGVWYDAAYHGQPTVNIRRGSSEYKALDGGLKNIAQSLDGTCVVVWKDKAYRIQ